MIRRIIRQYPWSEGDSFAFAVSLCLGPDWHDRHPDHTVFDTLRLMTQETLRDRVPDTVPDDVELFERDGIIWGRDDHGEFKLNPMRGSAEPVDGRCGAVCVYTQERYGQTRYCTGMPESTFVDGGSDFCKRHKSRKALMERAHELFEHGYFAANYVNFAEKLSPSKFLFAVEMVGGLFEMSQHDFETNAETRTIDTSDSELIKEDAVEVELPIPSKTTLSFQADQLWQAALAEVEMNNMREVVFEDQMEKKKISQTADMEGKITDTKYESVEHHLHLPISRLTKDIKEHLQNGGVQLDDDDGGVVTFQQNDYTLDVSPKETDSDATEDSSDTARDFSEAIAQNEAEKEKEEVEVEVE